MNTLQLVLRLQRLILVAVEGEELLEVQVGDEGSNQVSNGNVISTVLVVVLSHQERERATYDSAATDDARNSQTDHE